MKRARATVTLLTALILVFAPAAALARRPATKHERAAIVTAVVRQRQLSPAQARCQVITISTVNSSYAMLAWPRRLSAACERVAANGVILEHRTSRGWRFVTVGSALHCPIKGVPSAVARDLRVCS